jgi:hypothetical protein
MKRPVEGAVQQLWEHALALVVEAVAKLCVDDAVVGVAQVVAQLLDVLDHHCAAPAGNQRDAVGQALGRGVHLWP